MSENLNQDYLRFSKEITKSSKSIFKIQGTILTIFKKHHKSIYSIALIISKLKKEISVDNQLVFLAEILSDLLIVTRLAFLGFESCALIVLRRIIENFYNHIYYTDHSIEFQHLNLGKNEYTPIEKLKTYFDTHPNFSQIEDPNLKDFNGLLFKEYQQLCKVVHSKGIDALNLAECLKDLTEVFDLEAFLKLTINIELYIVYLSYKFHKNIKFTATEKGVITSIIPTNKRNYLNV